MAPFRGIFEPIPLTDQSVLDTSLLFAMIIYGLVALLLRAGIDWLNTAVARHQRQLEQEAWARATAEAAVAGTVVHQPPAATRTRAPSASPNVVVPAAPTRTSTGDPPPPGGPPPTFPAGE
jgi:hypothetical protein